jgi:lipopolysaccharide/colanic/teichoic acid biosynthesis glycosyltransferase
MGVSRDPSSSASPAREESRGDRWRQARGIAPRGDLDLNVVSAESDPPRSSDRTEGVSSRRRLAVVPDAGQTAESTFLPPDAGLLGALAWQRAAKRSMDVLVGAVAFVLVTPLFAGIATVVALTSRGPVFYVQDRVGRNGDVFRFLKFRTMHVDADAQRNALLEHNEMDGPVFKMRDDPRLTRVGRVLRKYSLDELPQLVHVIRGDMSLVGPRPPLPEEVAAYGMWERQRLLVKPGITCIWQVSGRSDVDFQTWVAMDIEYIRTWRLRLDLALLARTVPAVLAGEGAY